MKAVLKSRLWIPIKAVNKTVLKDEFLIRSFNERQCERCEYLPERFCDICAECPAFLGEHILWKKQGSYLGVPTGDRAALKRLLRTKVEIEDRRAKPKQSGKLKLVSKLYPHQIPTVEAACKAGYGVLLAPPRSGKTLMAIAVSLRLGVKTLILGAQQDWLQQFMTEFEAHTNLKDVSKFIGHPLVKMTNDPMQMQGADVVLSTYQSFISASGKARLAQIANMFGLVIIDETHQVPASAYARTVLGINARYKIGLTATDKRKDGKETLLYKIVGPVKAQAHVETLKPKVYFHATGVSTKYNYRSWVYAMRFLYQDKKRNAMIVKQALKDIKDGRHLVIPVGTVKHAKLITYNINKAYGSKVAEQFTSNRLNKKLRGQILDDARSGKIKCIVGTRQLVQVGINVPRWDCLYEVAPISNVPKFTQETSRIRTKMPGKPQPIIRHFIEDFGPSVGCLRTCLFQTYMKERFEIDPRTKQIAFDLVNKKKPQSSSNFGLV